MLNKKQILQLNCYALSVNCRKIRIYRAQNINYNSIIISIIQRNNIVTRKTNIYKYLSCFLKYC